MRGAPLANRDEQTRAAIAALGDPIDQQGVRAAWDASLAAKPWSDELVWLHGDLLPGNLIVRDRRLVAVIDFGALGIGDPAVDLQPAWKLFDAPARAVFREAMGLDDDAWERGRGWSLSLSVVGLEYYWDRMPRFADGARRELDALLGRDKMGS
jgi:aminoglycoside phosphotransferase (APT) family kinase protein